ncbi:hypothetical protein [Nitrobacter sp. JJSN]|uniref:hypothetical protein n=1 Tax=Nitrobacter sp. JJSN TaxID=3453033 RepID=UPI003F76BA57
MSHDYAIFWKDKASHDFEYGALRTKNLAEEIIVGWRDQTVLDGFDHELTAHALEHYGVLIQGGLAETHHDEFARNTIALCCRNLSWEMQKEGSSKLSYDETMLAARALKAFSEYLRGRIVEPAPAKAA